ncbi:MAG: fibronectin type III domain-containing protein [Janthinobacterium lividum]
MPNFYSTLRRFAMTALLSGGGLLAAQAQNLSQPLTGAATAAGTYTDLGTTGTVISTANLDDANSAAQDIGFPFSFNGTIFTQFVLNTNGLIRMGSAAPSTAALHIDGTGTDPLQSLLAADVNLIMPFNLDLVSGTGGAEYRVTTTGTAGSRICTIQWKNVADKAYSGNPQQYSSFSFQVRLYEGPGTIEFVYNAPTVSTAAATSRFSNVGLKGSGIGSGQVLVAAKTSTTAWSATTFQNTPYGSISTHDIDNSTNPTAGRLYRFTDPTYCVSLPVSAYPYTQNFDGVTAPALPCGISVVDANSDSNTWTNFNSATYASSTPNSMRYSGNTNQANDWFFTNPLTMTAGQSYQLQFKYRSYSATYTQALEVKVGTAATVAGQTTTVFTNSAFNNATYNTTSTSQVVLFTPTTTGTYYFGFHAISNASQLYLNVDDVKVDQVATPACPQPINLAATNVTATGATVTFTPPIGGTTYTVVYGASGFNPTTGGTTTTASASTSITLSGLNSNSPYDVYVQATCGSSGTSILTGPISFRTACATVTSYPYLENFDGVTAPALPCGVTVINANNDTKTWVNTANATYAASGTNAMTYTYNLTGPADDWFFTNALQMTAGKSYQLQFKYRVYLASYPEAMEVKVGTSNTVAGQTTTLFTNNNLINVTYATTTAGSIPGQVMLFTPTTTGVYYFGFHATSLTNQYNLYVDDLRVDETNAPACPQPINLAIGGITPTTATVTFTPPTNGTQYTVIYGSPGFNPATGGTTTPPSTSTSITLTGLTSNTNYDVYVQATCGTNGASVLTGPVSFTSACATTTTFPYTENFDGVVAPILPCGITVLDTNGDSKRWENYSSTTYAASGSNSMRYNYSTSVAADDWFFTNAMSMQAGNTYQLQFKYRSYISGYTQGLEVKVGTANTAAGQTTTVFSSSNITNTTYVTTAAGTGAGQVTSFTPTSTGVYYFGFHANSAASQYYLYVDDVQVTLTSLGACPTPSGLAVSGITANTATVTFNAVAGTSYRAIYGARNFNPNTGGTASAPVTTGSVTLTTLTPITNYDVYIQATCGTNGNSLVSGPINFTTACATTIVFPYQEAFDGVTAPALPCGITTLDVNNDGSTWVNDTDNPSSGRNSMRYLPSSANAADDWFFTNAMNLKANMKYQLQFKYRVFSYNYPEKMEVKIGTSTTAASQTTTLFSNMAILNGAYTTTSPGTQTGNVNSFTPPADGTYFIGFHAMSVANSFSIYVDDISVEASAVTATKSSVAPGFSAQASPVPFSDHLTLTLQTLAAGPLQLTLHDAVGRVVRETTATVPAGASSLAVPGAGALPAGMYILTVRQGGNTQVIRVAHE